jgi:hypothetical protein
VSEHRGSDELDGVAHGDLEGLAHV